MKESQFLTDIKTLRERARKEIKQGVVTQGYRADREAVIKILNEALATEIICVLRYKRHFFMASGINAQSELRLNLAGMSEGQRGRHAFGAFLKREGAAKANC